MNSTPRANGISFEGVFANASSTGGSLFDSLLSGVHSSPDLPAKKETQSESNPSRLLGDSAHPWLSKRSQNDSGTSDGRKLARKSQDDEDSSSGLDDEAQAEESEEKESCKKARRSARAGGEALMPLSPDDAESALPPPQDAEAVQSQEQQSALSGEEEAGAILNTQPSQPQAVLEVASDAQASNSALPANPLQTSQAAAESYELPPQPSASQAQGTAQNPQSLGEPVATDASALPEASTNAIAPAAGTVQKQAKQTVETASLESAADTASQPNASSARGQTAPDVAAQAAETAKALSGSASKQTSKPEQGGGASAPSLANESASFAAQSQPSEASKAQDPAQLLAPQNAASASAASQSQAQAAKASDSGLSSQQGGAEQLLANAAGKLSGDSARINVVSSNSSQQGGSQQQDGQQAASGDSSQQQSILKDLLGRQSNYAAAAARSKAPQAANARTAAQAISAATALPGAAQANAMAEKASALGEISSLGEASGRREAKNDASTALGAAGLRNDPTALASNPLAKARAASSTNEIVNAIQELIARSGTPLKGSNLDSSSKLTMEISIDGFGSLKLSLERSGERISVNMQAGSDSGKEQLSSQRQDIERDLRKLGYSDVSLDFGSSASGREGASDSWRRNGSSLSNAANEENVKLAGDKQADLSEILAMN